MIRAWAVHENGKILPNTVYETRRGAIVNYLICNGVMVGQTWTDEQIEQAWGLHRNPFAEAIEVWITDMP